MLNKIIKHMLHMGEMSYIGGVVGWGGIWGQSDGDVVKIHLSCFRNYAQLHHYSLNKVNISIYW